LRDLGGHLEKLQLQVTEYKLISQSALEQGERELFDRLARQVDLLAKEVECEMLRQKARNASIACRSNFRSERP